MSSTKLELRLHKVVCADETGTGTVEKLFSDDIALSGLAVDSSGATSKIGEFKIGVFDDKDKKVFSPPRRLALFDLRAGNGFPKSCAATLVLAEKDRGGLAKVVSGLRGSVDKKVKSHLAAAVGGTLGIGGGPGGVALGLVVGEAVDRAFGTLKEIAQDEIFPPKTVAIEIKSSNQAFKGGAKDTMQEVLTFKAHKGTYRLSYDWRLLP